MKNNKYIISAFNVHAGGGLVLLKNLINQKNIKYNLLDKRVYKKIKYPSSITSFVRREIIQRIFKSQLLFFKSNPHDTIMCFNGLPPLFKTKARVILFVQTFYFFEKIKKYQFNWLINLRIIFEQTWFNYGIRYADEIWLQTLTMKKRFLNYLKIKKIKKKYKICIKPLIDKELFLKLENYKQQNLLYKNKKPQKEYIFFYPADQADHKNHLRLLIATKSIRKKFKLYLTINPKNLEKLFLKADFHEEHKLNIFNLNQISRNKVLQFLQNYADCLIFPSLDESFGLPLIEAAICKKPIMGSNLPYVHDMIDTPYLFNPYKVSSICSVINKFMNDKYKILPNLKKQKFILANEFIGNKN